jgi:hypothetical protein
VQNPGVLMVQFQFKSWDPRHPGELMLQIKLEENLLENSAFLGSPVFLFYQGFQPIG